MTTLEISDAIIDELKLVLSRVSADEAAAFCEAVRTANRVFVSGAGRSLLMIRSFAMRLMQSGFQAFVVGETTTPSIQKGDLLIIASGSGETGTLKVIAAGAKKSGAMLALITSEPHSGIGQQADCIVTIPASTPKSDAIGGKVVSIQPGASAFEQCVLLLCDAMVIRLSRSDSVTEQNSGLMKLHANLE